MYVCKDNKIKTKLIFTNWDNATTKPYNLKPDTVYCWGTETSKLSNKIHKINSKAIGSIRFEMHRETKKKFYHLKKITKKKKIKIKKKLQIFTFCRRNFSF